MAIDAAAVMKIARLSRIRVSEAEKEKFAESISGILQWVEQLDEVAADDVPQMASVSDMSLPWREDKVSDGNRQAEVLQNAPQSDYGCFLVPKVIE